MRKYEFATATIRRRLTEDYKDFSVEIWRTDREVGLQMTESKLGTARACLEWISELGWLIVSAPFRSGMDLPVGEYMLQRELPMLPPSMVLDASAVDAAIAAWAGREEFYPQRMEVPKPYTLSTSEIDMIADFVIERIIGRLRNK